MESRQVIITKDGSHSIAVPAAGLTYHSTHGAIQESRHVFIEAGLHKAMESFPTGTLNIFEMGFGTGLNALLSLLEERSIFYECVEAFPLEHHFIKQLNYCDLLVRPDLQPAFEQIHNKEEAWITDRFYFKKGHTLLQNYQSNHQFHVIYFDAFDPDAQPELWTKEIFEKMYAMLVPGGLLTTYSSKGSIRRNLIAAGFVVEKIPGPPGKREMVRAMKINSTYSLAL